MTFKVANFYTIKLAKYDNFVFAMVNKENFGPLKKNFRVTFLGYFHVIIVKNKEMFLTITSFDVMGWAMNLTHMITDE